MRLFDKLDLFVLKVRGASAATAGLYGAAQNLTVVPALIGTAFAPVLLSALTHTMRDGEEDLAREVAQDAVRFTILLLPFAALIAASSPAIATLVLGQAFASAAPFLAILIFAGFARLLVSVSLSILIAAERPRWVLWLTGPVVPLAVAAYVIAILYGGARGAALTTTTLSVLLTIFSLAAVYLAWEVRPSAGSMARTVLFSAMVYAGALAWPATGIMLLIKLTVIGGIVPAVYYVTGEIGRDEIALVRSLARPKVFPTDEKRSAARKAVGMGAIERVRGEV
jgi:O-antigen/teichoic acid export membrane protein